MNDFNKLITAGLFVMASGGCTSDPPPRPDDLTLCSDPRPVNCDMDYEPVCGYLSVDDHEELRTFCSACTACSFEEVIGYLPGEC